MFRFPDTFMIAVMLSGTVIIYRFQLCTIFFATKKRPGLESRRAKVYNHYW